MSKPAAIDRMLDAYGAGQERGWNDALDAVVRALRRCPTYDENGYITKWSDATDAIHTLRRDTYSTRDRLVTALISIRDGDAEPQSVAREALQP